MATISASMVNDLRNRTGLGMMECKKALVEAGGDLDKAIDDLRKKGVKDKISSRTATEGRVGTAVNGDKNRGAVVEVLCNTDFTARNEIVAKVIDLAAQKLIGDPNASPSDDPQIKELLVTVSQQTGENVTLGRTRVLDNPGGRVGSFLYTVTNKIGVLVSVDGNASDELLNDLALHITAFKPVAVSTTREGVDPELVNKEREIAIEQAKATGKPQNIAEKIAEGKMNAFYQERVLGEQAFINADKFKGSIDEMLKKAGVTLKEYARVEVGQA